MHPVSPLSFLPEGREWEISPRLSDGQALLRKAPGGGGCCCCPAVCVGESVGECLGVWVRVCGCVGVCGTVTGGARGVGCCDTTPPALLCRALLFFFCPSSLHDRLVVNRNCRTVTPIIPTLLQFEVRVVFVLQASFSCLTLVCFFVSCARAETSLTRRPGFYGRLTKHSAKSKRADMMARAGPRLRSPVLRSGHPYLPRSEATTPHSGLSRFASTALTTIGRHRPRITQHPRVARGMRQALPPPPRKIVSNLSSPKHNKHTGFSSFQRDGRYQTHVGARARLACASADFHCQIKQGLDDAIVCICSANYNTRWGRRGLASARSWTHQQPHPTVIED